MCDRQTGRQIPTSKSNSVGKLEDGEISFTHYLSSAATFLITSDNSFFAFTERGLSLAGGCSDCRGPCKIVLLKYSLFEGRALTSAPAFAAFAGQPPTESLYDFSSLSPEVIALGESLDAEGAICESGINDWGSAISVVTATPQLVMNVITIMNLIIPPQSVKELQASIIHAEECPTTWTIMAIPRQFSLPADRKIVAPRIFEFRKISAVAINIFPGYTECWPDTSVDDNLIVSKLALATNGQDLLPVVPGPLTLFPYGFKSSMSPISRIIEAVDTKFEASTVLEPPQQAYYGGCRVREVNTTGVYIEGDCETSGHWNIYGLMVQSPDDIPLCTTDDVCVHNYCKKASVMATSETLGANEATGDGVEVAVSVDFVSDEAK
ncbi:hypothetical protein ON010_g12669 [Phytophthora cinnamomi]|nr:hypothetical protein ON010_g12669 [Phytophthora cinnamomi]